MVLHGATDCYLLPLAWLADVNVSACYQLDGHGRCAGVASVDRAELTVCFTGAEHGVPGLPNDVVGWPQRRSYEEAYLTVPDDPDWIAARLSAYPGWLPIYRRRPNVPQGYHLLQVDVAQRRAIDVPATVALVAGRWIAPSALAMFTGVDLALPARAFATTTITKVHPGRPHGRVDAGPSVVGRPLTEALPVPLAA